jgi:hypothetical protein
VTAARSLAGLRWYGGSRHWRLPTLWGTAVLDVTPKGWRCRSAGEMAAVVAAACERVPYVRSITVRRDRILVEVGMPADKAVVDLCHLAAAISSACSSASKLVRGSR